MTLEPSYVDNILKETEMASCNSANTPGTSALKANIDDDELLSTDQHEAFRRIVGKLQWLAYIRPDMAYAIKELARSIQQPCIRDQRKLKHLIRYLAGTKHYTFNIKPSLRIDKNYSATTIHLISTSLSTAIGQDVHLRENPHLDSSFSFVELPSASDQEHNP